MYRGAFTVAPPGATADPVRCLHGLLHTPLSRQGVTLSVVQDLAQLLDLFRQQPAQSGTAAPDWRQRARSPVRRERCRRSGELESTLTNVHPYVRLVGRFPGTGNITVPRPGALRPRNLAPATTQYERSPRSRSRRLCPRNANHHARSGCGSRAAPWSSSTRRRSGKPIPESNRPQDLARRPRQGAASQLPRHDRRRGDDPVDAPHIGLERVQR